MIYKLGKLANGKLRVSDGKLCRSCCPGDTCSCCPTQLSPPCIACPDFCIPAVVRVNLSGITVASDCQYWYRRWGVWCDYSEGGWRKFDFEGSALDGSYDVPIGLTGQGDFGRYCGGFVDVPFNGRLENFYPQDYIDDPCSYGCGDYDSTDAVFTKLRVSVGGAYVKKVDPQFPHPEVPPEFMVFTVSVYVLTDSDSGYKVFQGSSEQFPLYPVEARTCFGTEGQGIVIHNSQSPYECDLGDGSYAGDGICPGLGFHPGWDGTATISAATSSGCVPFYFHIKSFGPLQSLGSYLGGYLDLDDDLLPQTVRLRIAYKFSFERGESINEVCSYSNGYPFIGMPYAPDIGLVSLEILSMTNHSASNIIWDQSADEAPHELSGVF